VVPGTFGNESQSVVAQDAFVTAKMEGYWAWSKNESRIRLINPWHWASSPKDAGEYGRGAEDFPKLLARMREIGREIMKGGGTPP
jgi:hypothetical protein